MTPPPSQPAPPRQVVLLTTRGDLCTIVANGLASRLGRLTVIEEAPETTGQVMRRRLRLCGPVEVAGQLMLGLARKLGARARQARMKEIWRERGLDPVPAPSIPVHRVASVNSEAARDLLRRLAPDVVAVYSTRIIGAATLSCVEAPFINYHAGINPKYRGQHPGYWARACGDDDNCGVTIHLVDRGVDTGAVLYQARTTFDRADTIGTYQHVQTAVALPLFARAIEDALTGRLAPHTVDLPSQLWFPPTLWSYMATGLRRGVW